MITKSIIILILAFPFLICAQPNIQKQYENIILIGNTSDIQVLEHLISQFDEAIFGFQKSVGSYLSEPITIRIAADETEYQSWTKGTSRIIEFSQAFYSRKTDTIYLRNPSKMQSLNRLQRIMLHEYIHHFVSRFVADVPLWFNEGMAVYFSGDMGFDREFNFARNHILGNTRPLNMMKYSYPRNQIEWESFYAKSGLAVKYLYTKKRVEFYRLWDYMSRQQTFESAFMKAFLMTTSEFSKFFEEYTKTRFRTEILLASTGMIWSVLPLVLIIGFIRKKIRNKKRIKEWEIEEDNSKFSPQLEMKDKVKEKNEGI